MANPTAKMRRLAEVELLRAEIEARRIVKRAIWVAIAILVGFLALAISSYALYLFLALQFGALNAAIILGVSLTLLALCALGLAYRKPGRTEQLEAEILARSIKDARDDLNEDFEAIENTVNQFTGGFSQFMKGGSLNLGGKNANLAAITLILSALTALSPTLKRYIQPILKIIG